MPFKKFAVFCGCYGTVQSLLWFEISNWFISHYQDQTSSSHDVDSYLYQFHNAYTEKEEFLPLVIYNVMSILRIVSVFWFIASVFLIYTVRNNRCPNPKYFLTKIAYAIWAAFGYLNCFYDLYLTIILLYPLLKLISYMQITYVHVDMTKNDTELPKNNYVYISGKWDDTLCTYPYSTAPYNDTLKAVEVAQKSDTVIFSMFAISFRIFIVWALNLAFSTILVVATQSSVFPRPKKVFNDCCINLEDRKIDVCTSQGCYDADNHQDDHVCCCDSYERPQEQERCDDNCYVQPEFHFEDRQRSCSCPKFEPVIESGVSSVKSCATNGYFEDLRPKYCNTAENYDSFPSNCYSKSETIVFEDKKSDPRKFVSYYDGLRCCPECIVRKNFSSESFPVDSYRKNTSSHSCDGYKSSSSSDRSNNSRWWRSIKQRERSWSCSDDHLASGCEKIRYRKLPNCHYSLSSIRSEPSKSRTRGMSVPSCKSLNAIAPCSCTNQIVCTDDPFCLKNKHCRSYCWVAPSRKAFVSFGRFQNEKKQQSI